MNIAIMGAGFSGLATAWYLLKQTTPAQKITITILDPNGIGGGASGIAAGLLHPFAGAHAKLNQLGKEGFAVTSKLLDVASAALGQPVAHQLGILRLALTDDQEADFAFCAEKYPEDIEWLDSAQCHARYPQMTLAPGIWIKNGFVVNSGLYLQGLWQACAALGATFKKLQVTSLKELDEFDSIIMATGADSIRFPELSGLGLSIVKGQVLELEWPPSLPPLPFPLNSQAYLLMTDPHTCLAGATFERGHVLPGPDSDVAEKDIMPKVAAMLPALKNARIKHCHAAYRAVTPNHLPAVEQLSPRLWVITGMGSKGLLYHALMAEKLTKMLLKTS